MHPLSKIFQAQINVGDSVTTSKVRVGVEGQGGMGVGKGMTSEYREGMDGSQGN